MISLVHNKIKVLDHEVMQKLLPPAKTLGSGISNSYLIWSYEMKIQIDRQMRPINSSILLEVLTF